MNETYSVEAILNEHLKIKGKVEKKESFIAHVKEGYTFKSDSIALGAAIFEGEPIENLIVKAPFKTFNRHGLIAGATGTGKTKTLQGITESLSSHGVPVLLMDIKGDLTGLAKESPGHRKIDERHAKIGLPFVAKAFPVEPMTISKDTGVKLRATVSEFGPILLAKILELNDNQSGVLSVVFKYCDDKDMPLVDLKDLKKVIQYVVKEGKEELEEEYGSMSSASVGVIIRKIMELEQQGGELFFGEPSFEVNDLLRKDTEGNGYINVLRLTDIQAKPKLFSTFMLSLLAEIYASFPEQGDADKPKLVIFIDEAHLIFNNASKALLEQLDAIVKLIRSKGVGLFFCTQVPSDVPENILSQLGLRVQHALRAVTAKDRKRIKEASQNFPLTDYYKTDKVLTELGIGEAFVTVLNEKGIPTPLVATYLCAPQSRMDILSKKELDHLVSGSDLYDKYNKSIDEESAYEILEKKIERFKGEEVQKKHKRATKGKRNYNDDDSLFEELSKNTMVRQVGRTLVRELTRGLLGVLGVK